MTAMAGKGRANPGAGRPSKGDRHAFMTRIPRETADALMAEAERLNVTYGDLIAYHVARSLGTSTKLPQFERLAQEALPLTG